MSRKDSEIAEIGELAMPFYSTDDGTRLYYEIHGRGEDNIIFIHGLTANHRHFKYQVNGLKSKFRILTYDITGHGDSDLHNHDLILRRLANDFNEVIRLFNVTNVTLVGWSLGVHVIFEYIKEFGQKCINKICIIIRGACLEIFH